jgi:hypothetical protein
LAVSLALLVPHAALACPICFGDPGSPMSRGVEMGIWFLLGVILLVQAGFGVFFFVYLRKRLRPLHDPLPRPVLKLVKNA